MLDFTFEEYRGKHIVVYYSCSGCNEGTVSNEILVDDEFIDSIGIDSIFIGLICTECGIFETYISFSDIHDIEVIDR